MGSPTQIDLDGRHLDAEELDKILKRGFRSSDRRSEALLHLAAACGTCGEGLKAMVGRRAGAPDRPQSDPVALSLRDWIEVRRCPRTASRLRPVHRYWVDRESFAPLGFCRAVLERGRQLAIDHQDRAVGILGALRKDLSDPRLRQLDEEVFHDLLALASTSLAEASCAVTDFFDAEDHLREAEKELTQGSGDRETRATLYEAQADLELARGEDKRAFAYLDAALALLRACEIPGRRAEALARKGIALLRRGYGYQAEEALSEALTSLPHDVYPRLRLEVLHNLAAAKVRTRDFRQALRHLASAKTFYDTHPLEPMATQRLWLLGVSYLGVEREDKAESPLREALDRYCELKEWDGAAHALASLASLYCSSGRSDDFEVLERRFSRVIRSAPGRRLALAGIKKAVRLAGILKVPVPQLEKDLRELETQEGGEWEVN